LQAPKGVGFNQDNKSYYEFVFTDIHIPCSVPTAALFHHRKLTLLCTRLQMICSVLLCSQLQDTAPLFGL